MVWIESHQEIAQHPKTRRLARYLGVSIPDAIGRLHLLWWWAMNYAEDGDLSGFDPEELADATLWEGDGAALKDALIRSGFLDENGHIHDWDDYAGKLIDRRKANADRMRAARASTTSIEGNARATHVRRTQRARVGLPYPTVPDHTLPLEANASSTDGPSEVAASAAKTTTKTSPVALVALSEDAKAVLEFWRQAHGKRSLPKINPTQATQLEDAVIDLGCARLSEAVTYMAARGVPELSKAINAAKTKRQQEEKGAAPQANGYHARAPALSALQTLGADDTHLKRDWNAELGGG